MEEKCILGVFAHPDDESFSVGGIMYNYSKEGIRTAVVCATRGEAGEISDPSLSTPETLAAVREQELREACRILGIGDLAFLDYRDGRLAEANVEEATGRLVRQIRRIRPQVVVTFGANGGYGHTDHIAIHHITNRAFGQAGDPTCYPEQLAEGLEPYAPQKLYYGANARGVMSKVRGYLVESGETYAPGGNAATIPVEQMGTPDEAITTAVVLDDAAYEAKLRAWDAHRTQNGTASFMRRLPPDLARLWRGTERFERAIPPASPGEHETDLFAGVRLA